MARIHNAGDRVGKYTIRKLLSRGAFAISYEALADSGERVFFKQYKSPTPTVHWFRDYVRYQAEIKKRVESGPAKNFCYRFIDQFEITEPPRAYYQVFEFIDAGTDLRGYLESMGRSAGGVPWGQRVTFAKVLLAGLAALHDSGVVHSDLKPENVHLIPDADVVGGSGFKPRLIDMDFSLLPDRRAPWHGHSGYFGTANYMSPEHISAGVPGLRSDVFTAALILAELLCPHGHPYIADTPEEYHARLKRGPSTLALDLVSMEGVGREFPERMRAALEWNHVKRPTARELHQALLGRVPAPSPTSRPKPATSRSKPSPPIAGTARRLTLRASNGASIPIGVRTAVGHRLLKPMGEDAQFYSEPQFTIEPSGSDWYLVPEVKATNETLVNGETVTVRLRLKGGDVVAVGRKSKGVTKLPLRVELS
jgi:eukaryotic-like serine/threonine-protein kinase